MEGVELAQSIAVTVHNGQVDKGGNPYIIHPATVASHVDTEDEKIVAWLHDVVEDTPMTINDLRCLFSDSIINAVDAITKRDGENRHDYMVRVRNNPIACRVKIADLIHNCDITRISNPTAKDFNRVDKYKKEINWLRDSMYG